MSIRAQKARRVADRIATGLGSSVMTLPPDGEAIAWGRRSSVRLQRLVDLILGPCEPSAHGVRGAATLSTRVLGHVGVWSYAVRSRSKPATILAVASLANDVVAARRLRRADYVPGPMRWISDSIDAGVWAGILGSDPSTGRPAMLADSVPSAADASFVFAAGTRAQPLPTGVLAWPPHGRAGAYQALRALVPIFLPPFTFWAVRRVRGQRGGFGLCGWGLSSAVLFTIVARNRDAQQVAVTRAWEDRASSLVVEQQKRSQVWAATEEHDGHEFKRVLMALGAAGSQPAMAALHAQMARPSEVLSFGTDGAIVEQVARGINVLSGASVWLSGPQCKELAQFLAYAEEAGTGETLDLTVSRPSPLVIEFAYLGESLRLASVSPHRERPLGPIIGGLLYGVSVRVEAVITQQFPWRAAVAASCIDLAGTVIFWRYPPSGSLVPWFVAISGLSTYLSVWAVIRENRQPFSRYGTPQLAAGGPLMVHAMVLAFFRRQLSPPGHLGACLGLFGVFWYSARRSGLAWIELVDALVGVLMPFGISWDLEERFEFEAALLDQRLAADFERQISDAHRLANEAELKVFQEWVELADRELARLLESGLMDDSLARWASGEIQQTRFWVRGQLDMYARDTDS